MQVDLNCDMGESFGAYSIGADEAVMPVITSANIACGFHGGDPGVIRRTVQLAGRHGVAVGAHPGFPDLVGFGRRPMVASPEEVEDFVLYQIAAVAGIARAEGVALRHVKCHGALNNMTQRDDALSAAIARAVAAFDGSLILYCMAGSRLLQAGEAAGLRVVSEGFPDRAYESDGTLVSRRTPGAVIHDAAAVVARTVRMVRDGTVVALEGAIVPLRAETLCIHGDNPEAPTLVREIRTGLESNGIAVRAFA
jgi:UPF0271 protein